MQRETRSRGLSRHNFHYPVELVSLKWTSSPCCFCTYCQFITDHLTSLKGKAWGAHTGVTFLGKPFPKKNPAGTPPCLPPRSPKCAYTATRVCSWLGLPACPPAQTPRQYKAGQFGAFRQFSEVVGLNVGLPLSFGLGARKQQKHLDERRQKALWDLLQVNEECKSHALPDKRQQPENYQGTELTLKPPQDMEQCGCRKHRGWGRSGGTTTPAGEIKCPLPLTWAGVRQVPAKSCCRLFSWSRRAKPQQEMLQHSCGPGEGSPQLMGEDGCALQGAAGPLRWPCWGPLPPFPRTEMPPEGACCGRRKFSCATAVNSFIAP